MILPILFLFLLVIIVSLCLFFLFILFLPSLKAQKIDALDPMFSKEEVDAVIKNGDFNHAETGLKAFVFSSEENAIPTTADLKQDQEDCALFVYENSSDDSRTWNCVGLGNCIRFCPRNAISIKNGSAFIGNNCNGCGLCVETCPMNLIRLVSVEKTSLNIDFTGKKGFKFWQK